MLIPDEALLRLTGMPGGSQRSSYPVIRTPYRTPDGRWQTGATLDTVAAALQAPGGLVWVDREGCVIFWEAHCRAICRWSTTR